jgi:nitroreductase
MIEDLIRRSRTIRRFDEGVPIRMGTLRGLVGLARISPSAANRQPLRYLLCTDRDTCGAVFEHLAWAGYLTDWPGPPPGERPTAYIVMVLDTEVSPTVDCDHGIAAQSILLGATEQGLGGCIIGSLEEEGLRRLFDLDDRYEILLVLALGIPVERVVLDETVDGGIRYWRDDDGVHHVPKRPLGELILDEIGA